MDNGSSILLRNSTADFGGTNGGTLAAVCVFVARSVAPDRIPIGIDARFIRGFRPGLAQVVPTVLNEGRTLTTVSVDILTEEGKLATRGTVSFAVPAALAEVDKDGARAPLADLIEYEQGRQWRQPKGPSWHTFDRYLFAEIDGCWRRWDCNRHEDYLG